MSDQAGSERARLIHNERIKLLAGAFNNLGLAVIVAGFVAPVVTGHLYGVLQVAVAASWLVMGCALHLTGQAFLGRLRP